MLIEHQPNLGACPCDVEAAKRKHRSIAASRREATFFLRYLERYPFLARFLERSRAPLGP
jgi:hypothetical protein